MDVVEVRCARAQVEIVATRLPGRDGDLVGAVIAEEHGTVVLQVSGWASDQPSLGWAYRRAVSSAAPGEFQQSVEAT